MRRNPSQGCELLYEAFLLLLIDKETQSLEEIRQQACKSCDGLLYCKSKEEKKQTNQQLCFNSLHRLTLGNFLLPHFLKSYLLFQITLLQHLSFVIFHPGNHKKHQFALFLTDVVDQKGVEWQFVLPMLKLSRGGLLAPVQQLPEQRPVQPTAALTFVVLI